MGLPSVENIPTSRQMKMGANMMTNFRGTSDSVVRRLPGYVYLYTNMATLVHAHANVGCR